MCNIFFELTAASYRRQSRSVRLGGHVTSIRLEALFWQILENVAAAEGWTLGRFLTRLHDEAIRLHGDIGNFTALLRCACIRYVMEASERASFVDLMEPAATPFADHACEISKSAFTE